MANGLLTRHQIIEAPVVLGRVVTLLEVTTLLQLAYYASHHQSRIRYRASGSDGFQLCAFVLVVGPCFLLAETITVAHVQTVGAFQHFSPGKENILLTFTLSLEFLKHMDYGK